MENNNIKMIKKHLTMADMPKDQVKKVLVSASRTRKVARARIKKDGLKPVPKYIGRVLVKA